jgi:hypothetical protein
MAAERGVTFADIDRAAKSRDPQLVELVLRFLAQGDPAPGQPEEPPELAPGEQPPPVPEGTWTLPRLRTALNPYNLQSKTATEKKTARREAWDGLLAAQNPPPRMKLAALLLELDAAGDEPARRALLLILKNAPIMWGPWQAMKRLYKLAETRHDAAVFGALAARFDRIKDRPSTGAGEIGPGTFVYLRRRAWRYLRLLGRALPELYPQFAAEVLKNYPADTNFRSCWVANQIWAHGDLVGKGRLTGGAPSKDLKKRAFDETWKLSPDPLLRLLEDAEHDQVADFAIRSLEKDFPDALRGADPRWLARIGKRPLTPVHEFIVKLFTESAELHQSKLRQLGLHEMVLGLLSSESAAARRYAIEYAGAHAPDLPIAELVRLASEGDKDVRAFAAARLDKKSGAELGLDVLVELLRISETAGFASAKLKQTFRAKDIQLEHFIRLATGTSVQRKLVLELYAGEKLRPPAEYLQKLLADPRKDWDATRTAVAELEKYSGKELGSEWPKKALFEPQMTAHVERWLKAGRWSGEDLDLEWLKSLVLRPRFRALAVELLQNTKLVSPAQVGLPWLLAMARQADETLHQFAHDYLLRNFAPKDFEGGLERIWTLAAGKGEPEAVRRFAAAYLRAHHPEIAAMKAQGIEPRLSAADFPRSRLLPLLVDGRQDVRELAAAIAKKELVRWGEPRLLFELADAAHREPRRLASELLLSIGEADADPAKTPPPAWLTASAVFALAESVQKPTRELGLTLVRRHYDRLGGAARLAWLMESPDREVRLFAVRLLWEKHRPLETPAAWTPKKKQKANGEEHGPRVELEGATVSLQQFLRGTMFGLPPGRMERRDVPAAPTGVAAPRGRAARRPDRALPASVAKRRLIEVVRDMAVEDAAFASVVVPILEEFTRSSAKGEWQSCVAALARIQHAHRNGAAPAGPPPEPAGRPGPREGKKRSAPDKPGPRPTPATGA